MEKIMEKQAVFTNLAGKPGGHYSQAIRFNNILYTSGTVGKDPATGLVVSGGVKAQVRQALENIKVILAQANTSLDNVLKVNAYLQDINNFADFNEIYKEYFRTNPPPARTTVEVGFADGIEFEIDVIAFIPD
jgi:2-iminobutanoate/2-iminopropanoate deaminase